MKHYKETKCYYWDWIPVYEKYVDVEVSDYCYECGQKNGSHTKSQGVNLLRYDLKRFYKNNLYYMGRAMENLVTPYIEESIRTPSIFQTLLKKKF